MQITDYYLGADMAIFPGRHSVLWEKAVACGLPCIIKYAEGMQHVDVGGNCVFFKDGSPEGIKNAVLSVISNEEQLNNMSIVAKEKGIMEFSYINIAKKAIEMDRYD